VSLSISAFYELIEWWVSVLTGSAGDAFLWTQWYVWDTQSDMLYALIWSLVFVIQNDPSVSRLNQHSDLKVA
jgi:putative membrane protein